MRNQTTLFSRTVKVLAYLTSFFFATICFAQTQEHLELPKKVSELRGPAEGKPQASVDSPDMTALKSTLKFEILEELRGDKTLNWQQSVKPKLNFVELSGYFRTRADALNRCDLGTYNTTTNMGTSQCSPPLNYFPAGANSSNWLLSSDVRFRLDPTLNVSEDIRIKGRFDIFDNLVLGSTPAYMTGDATQANPAHPISVLPGTQNSPLLGVNSALGPLTVKRLWGEVSFPFGEFKFGRMPFGWGLGILFNPGNEITQDSGTNVDGMFFDTRFMGHDMSTGFTLSYGGPNGRGGGLGANGDNSVRWFGAEGSSRYDLDPSDNVYNLYFSFARKDCKDDAQALLDDNRSVLNYGILATYRFQINDSQYFNVLGDPTITQAALQLKQVNRKAHLTLSSLWSKFQIGSFLIEAEAAGVFGQIGNGLGLWNDATNPTKSDAIWIYQGGIALESRYGFMQNHLQIGLDGGWASGDPAPGFGIRPGLNKNPAPGAADGQQFGPGDNAITNFTFDRDYHVDMLLFREVLGTVSDALYLKPHVAYFFTDYLGLRGDVIGSMSNFARSTPGNNQWLGLELDASLFFKTSDGFVFNLQYGYLFPFGGLGYNNGVAPSVPASSASALRMVAGITF